MGRRSGLLRPDRVCSFSQEGSRQTDGLLVCVCRLVLCVYALDVEDDKRAGFGSVAIAAEPPCGVPISKGGQLLVEKGKSEEDRESHEVDTVLRNHGEEGLGGQEVASLRYPAKG